MIMINNTSLQLEKKKRSDDVVETDTTYPEDENEEEKDEHNHVSHNFDYLHYHSYLDKMMKMGILL